MTIPALEIRAMRLRLRGLSPLISHKWSEKARQEMRDKQGGKARLKKAPKDAEQDYEDSMYRLPDGRPGFPTVAFKAAAVDAASQIEGLTKTYLRGAFHIAGELVPIEGEPRMREDMVRVGMGTADIRYRAEFPVWSVDLPIRVNTRNLTIEQLVQLFSQAGFSVGVGEWRPQKDGSYGMFEVESLDEED